VRRQIPPKVRCNGTARSGERCRRYARPGRTVCVMHGAYSGPAGRPAMEERADAEVTLATLLASSPGRPVWEVILEALANVDALARLARARVVAGESSQDAMDRLADMSRLAHTMGASAVATKALDMAAQIPVQWGDLVADRVAVLLIDWLGVPIGRAVGEAVTVTLGAVETSSPSPAPRPDGPPLLALVGHAQAAELAPRLGLQVAELTSWLARVVEAVADGRPVPGLPGAPVAALPAAPVAPLPEPAPPAAEPAVLTLHSQAGDEAEEAEEAEVVDAELVEPEPEPRPRRITTQLGSRRAVPILPTSYRTF
jgi:hypothetical protein